MNDTEKKELLEVLEAIGDGDFDPKIALVGIVDKLTQIKTRNIETGKDVYSGQDIKNCDLAIYEVFWKSGGSSVASIGYDQAGNRWMAPTNWLNGSVMLDDERIDDIDYIVMICKQKPQL
jgi:hypothetical protein